MRKMFHHPWRLLFSMLPLFACGTDAGESALTATSLKSAMTPADYVVAKAKLYACKLEWVSGAPKPGDLASARLTFVNAAKEPAQRVAIEKVMAWMPSSAAPPTLAQVDTVNALPANQRDVAGIGIRAPGDWQISVVAAVDGVKDEVLFSFTVSAQ